MTLVGITGTLLNVAICHAVALRSKVMMQASRNGSPGRLGDSSSCAAFLTSLQGFGLGCLEAIAAVPMNAKAVGPLSNIYAIYAESNTTAWRISAETQSFDEG